MIATLSASLTVKETSVKTIGVIGAGQMGAGIAQVGLVAGFQVTLSDVSEAALAKGKAGIEKEIGRAHV